MISTSGGELMALYARRLTIVSTQVTEEMPWSLAWDLAVMAEDRPALGPRWKRCVFASEEKPQRTRQHEGEQDK